MTEERTPHHHHHHRHHHRDESEIFKNRQLKSKKRAKMFSNFLFTTGCILALLIIITVFWLYTNE